MAMNSNVRFANVPINTAANRIERSTFTQSWSHTTSFNSGKLIPIQWTKILPADTISFNCKWLVRSATPIAPTMGDAKISIYTFWIPMRLIWKDWQYFLGENPNEWANTNIYTPLKVKNIASGTYNEFSLANYLNIPLNYVSPADLPNTKNPNRWLFRATALVWNEFFRDQNTQKSIPLSDETVLDVETLKATPSLTSYLQNVELGIECPPVAKVHDYFTSTLPQPSKGESPTLQLGQFNDVPVSQYYQIDTNYNNPISTYDEMIPLKLSSGQSDQQSHAVSFYGGTRKLYSKDNEILPGPDKELRQDWRITGDAYAKTSNLQATGISVNQLRNAIGIQRLYEAFARGGTRYTELLHSIYGVNPLNGILQRPEFLGGESQYINVQQVLQTGASGTTGTLGDTGAFSLTANQGASFTKSFNEHGYIITFAFIRSENIYAYGIDRDFFRNDKLEYAWPQLSHVGETPVFNYEIWTGDNGPDFDPFGYQEKDADYRYTKNQVSGYFSPKSSQTLKYWTYASTFNEQPTLSNSFIQFDPSVISQTQALTSDNYPQFIAQFAFNIKMTRNLPLFGVPGLMDHF